LIQDQNLPYCCRVWMKIFLHVLLFRVWWLPWDLETLNPRCNQMLESCGQNRLLGFFFFTELSKLGCA
jgi:hypothetical protein